MAPFTSWIMPLFLTVLVLRCGGEVVVKSLTVDKADPRTRYDAQTGQLEARVVLSNGVLGPIYAHHGKAMCAWLAQAEEDYKMEIAKNDPDIWAAPRELEHKILRRMEQRIQRHGGLISAFKNYGPLPPSVNARPCRSGLWMQHNWQRFKDVMLLLTRDKVVFWITIDCPASCAPVKVAVIGPSEKIIDPTKKLFFLEEELEDLNAVTNPALFVERTEMTLMNPQPASMPAITQVRMEMPGYPYPMRQTFGRMSFDHLLTREDINDPSQFLTIHAPSIDQENLRRYFQGQPIHYTPLALNEFHSMLRQYFDIL